MTSALSHNLLLLFSPLAIGEEFAVIGDLDTWDRDPLDAHSEEAFLRFCRVHSTIACDQVGRSSKDRPMMGHGVDRLPMLLRVFQDLIAGHDPPATSSSMTCRPNSTRARPLWRGRA